MQLAVTNGAVFTLALLSVCASASAQTDVAQTLDIQTNGAYDKRPFARALGAAVVVQQSPPPEIPGTLIAESKTGETNELIVLLNYDSHDRLTAIIPGHVRTNAAPATERGFLEAINTKQSGAGFAFGNPVHARLLLNTLRMPDDERAKQVKLLMGDGKGGLLPNLREQMERYVVLRYETPQQAGAQLARLLKDPVVAYAGNNGTVTVSYTPTDPYFSNNGIAAQYQWGLHMMNFPTAWDVTRGQAYIGVLDSGWPGTVVGSTFTVHPDLQENFRQQMMNLGIGVTAFPSGTATPTDIYANHTIHVSGIIAATHSNRLNSNTQNNGNGATGFESNGAVAGACPECSFVTYPISLAIQTAPWSLATTLQQLVSGVDAGMQVINWSGGYRVQNACNNTFWSVDPVCTALGLATNRGVLVVISSGNNNNEEQSGAALLSNGPQFPGNLHDGSTHAFSVLPVGGITSTGQRWTTGALGSNETGANFASSYGIAAPAALVVSTLKRNVDYNPDANCSDNNSTADLSALRFGNGIGDGVATCTGTSMAAPHISAVAGLMRSVNPRASASSIRTMIRESGNLYPNPTAQLGYGVPNATTAVNKALATNPSRLTPLFSYFSPSRADSFYTTVPQMARAAAEDKLMPRNPSPYLTKYNAAYGPDVTGYLLPPEGIVSVGPDTARLAKAEVWVFTTDLNPKSTTVRLSPIVRMSWKCGDATPYPPALCSTNSSHIDTVLVLSDKAANQDEVPYFKYLGYKVDGIEGFVYPKSLPRPLGAVKLMRKYNATLDDHAMFPESAATSMGSQGWNYDTNATDWLGYVYPNTGPMPTIQ